MKKSGFTLAEVLITLTIIGIVAAMTMPALLSNVQKGQIGPALAKAINTLENANRMAMQQTDARNIVDAEKTLNGNTAPAQGYTTLLDNYVAGSIDASNAAIFTSKDGIQFSVAGKTAANLTTANSNTNKYSSKYYTVTIDINGTKKPGEGGRDKFKILVDTQGAVIPYGGNEWVKYTGADKKVECTADSYSDECTGVIAENGWAVPY